MKAMILADLLTMKKLLIQAAAIWTIVLFALSIVAFNSPVYSLFVGPVAVVMVVQGLMLNEEKGAWAGTRLAMPLSRPQIVAGRYVSLAVVAVGATALAACIYLFVATIDFAIPVIGEIARFQMAPDTSTLILCIGASLAISLLTLGFVLPFFVRFRSVNGMRYALIAVNFLFLIGIMVAINPSAGILAQGVLVFSGGLENVLLLSLGILAAGSAFYVASATIAIKLYAKREF